MRQSQREKLIAAKRKQFENVYLNSFEDLLRLILDGDRPQKIRQVNPTQLAFIQDPARIKAYMGPAGVAKTSTGVAEILIHAMLEPGTSYLIGRADYNDLEGTTMREAERQLRRLPHGTLLDRSGKPPATWWIKPAAVRLANGEEFDEPSEIKFMGLKDQMGSYVFNGAFIDEAAEVDRDRVHEVDSRLRHMRGHRFLSCAFNPPHESHWLYNACTGRDEHGDKVSDPWMKLFLPQKDENNRNLPDGYHADLAKRLPEDMRQRLIEGAWGSTFDGEPVIPQFKASLHCKADLKYGGGTLFRFWDFGFRRPACLWGQVTTDGRLQILREYLGHYMTGDAFIAQVLQLTAQHFGTARTFVDYGDPAVKQQKDTGSMLTLLHQAGVRMRFQHTPLDVSLRVLRKKFETLVKGEPAVAIVKRDCLNLVGALEGGYHFKRDGITPHKDEFYDHLVDALRYGIWNLFGVLQESTSSTGVRSVAAWDVRSEP